MAAHLRGRVGAVAALWRARVGATSGRGGAQRTFSWARYQELLQAGGAPPVHPTAAEPDAAAEEHAVPLAE